MTATARLPSIDIRCACVRLSLRPATRCGIGLGLSVQLCRGSLVELGRGRKVRLVAAHRGRLGGDESAQREALLELVQALLPEVAHAQELVVAERQDLADLGDAVALQR